MLSYFNKKEKLRDHFDGFVDIHNHILPGIDDGASTVEDSKNLIQRYSELGVQRLIATPHVMNDYYANTPDIIHKALEQLSEFITPVYPDFRIKAAAEYMMDHSFLETMENSKLLCLSKDLVLVEMSYFQAPINLHEILFKLQTQEYKPILAHPERYAYLHSKNMDKYKELKDRGCLFQMNILSLVGHYGKHIQHAVFELLDAGMIDFAGTDTHQVRHLEKIFHITLPRKRMSQLLPVLERTRETFTF